MTKQEISAAHFLLDTWEKAIAHGEELDPNLKRGPLFVVGIDRIAHASRDAFIDLTGKGPTEVNHWELNTETPAAWVKARKPPKR